MSNYKTGHLVSLVLIPTLKFRMSSLPELEACLSILPSTLPAPGSTINTTTSVLSLCSLSRPALSTTRPLSVLHASWSPPSPTWRNISRRLETGLFSASDVNTAEILSTLQLKVSKIREASLRNSLSHSGTLRQFFAGHTFTLLRCIREVRVLETHIEILKESQLRDDNLHPSTIQRRTRVAMVSLRRRRHSLDSI
ncbi:hypothetical protein B0H13DRAFT_2378580 [Mycena leptocephala]|nr:hypothetical protein B0H13DRAFT_2378580 [Mycena leptocephala]